MNAILFTIQTKHTALAYQCYNDLMVTLNTSLAHILKDSSCPHSSSPSIILQILSAPKSSNMLSK